MPRAAGSAASDRLPSRGRLLRVTRHALGRFCERCLNMRTPDSFAGRRFLSRLLVRAIGDSAEAGHPMVWGHWPAAIEGDRIVTVLEPGARLMRPGKAARRRAA